MSQTERVASFIALEMRKNVTSGILQQIKQSNHGRQGSPFTRVAGISALIRWKNMVGNEKPWDYKPYIRKTYGQWSYDASTNTHFNFDIWSNIHYGYIGNSVGFSKWILKSGAGYAQLSARNNPENYWKRRLNKIGDSDFLIAFDDPKDQVAIEVGMFLWDKHQLNITTNKVLSIVRQRRSELQTR